MIFDVPIYVYVAFFIAVTFSLVVFYQANTKNSKFILAILIWGTFHSILAISGFYENTKTIPPRFIMVIIPLLVIILLSIFSTKMKNWLLALNLKKLTYLHVMRVPVELTLYGLFLNKYVPEIMTFEGRNFDILIGLSAPLIAWFAFRNGKISTIVLWIFNILSILFLANILIIAILSVPTVMQQFGVEQPNVAVIRFPFILLPTIIVPLVLISNLAAFIILKNTKTK